MSSKMPEPDAVVLARRGHRRAAERGFAAGECSVYGLFKWAV